MIALGHLDYCKTAGVKNPMVQINLGNAPNLRERKPRRRLERSNSRLDDKCSQGRGMNGKPSPTTEAYNAFLPAAFAFAQRARAAAAIFAFAARLILRRFGVESAS